MAIIIPSSKIYEPVQNSKVKNNQIDIIEVGCYNVLNKDEYAVNVYNQRVSSGFTTETIIKKQNMDVVGAASVNVAYVHFIPKKVKVSVTINKTKENSYINKILAGVDRYEEPEIKFSLYGKIEKGTATGKSTSGQPVRDIVTGYPVESSTDYYSLPKSITANQGHVSTSINLPVYGNLKNITVLENDYSYTMDLELTVGGQTVTLAGTGSTGINLAGTYEEYTPIFAEFTIYGNTVGIDLKQETIRVFQNKTDSPFSIPRNELLQKSNYLTNSAYGISNTFNNTRLAYQNGKETAVILCSVGEYYTDSNQLAISTKELEYPMTFKIYDKVIPMTYGEGNKDRPMSLNKDGSPKVFNVLGVKVFYDGAVWQELSLQEI